MKTFISGTFLLLLFVSLCAQRPGDLYTDFGDNGIYILDWIDTSTCANSVGVQTDGNLIISGNYITPEDEVYVLKLDDEGNQLDFGNSLHGFVYDFSNIEYASSSFMLPDNKILIAGNYFNGGYFYPFVMRLLPDGSLDEEFSDDGIYTDESSALGVSNMAVYQTGDTYNIVICGGDQINNWPEMIMLDEDGELVTSFGTGGVVMVTSVNAVFYDIVVDNENNCLYACGYTTELAGTVIAKYDLTDGSLVTDFGIGGGLVYTEDNGFRGYAYSIVHDQENELVTVFGQYYSNESDYDIYAFRMKSADGAADSSFGVNGWATLRVAGSEEYIETAIQLPDGKYYFGGFSDYYGDGDFFLGRMNFNGNADTTFGVAGFVITDFGNDDYLNELALSPSGNVLYAAGYNTDFMIGAIVVSAYYTTAEITPPVTVAENESGSVHCFPNPSSGIITVETGLTGTYRVQVFDLSGTEVYNEHCIGKSISFNIGFLQPSVYFMKITSPDNQVITGKFIKK